eukprot:scaffold58552_cov29-Prasinocladus_malaysianus.AAC.1
MSNGGAHLRHSHVTKCENGRPSCFALMQKRHVAEHGARLGQLDSQPVSRDVMGAAAWSHPKNASLMAAVMRMGLSARTRRLARICTACPSSAVAAANSRLPRTANSRSQPIPAEQRFICPPVQLVSR